MNLILMLSHLFSIEGREPHLCDFVEKVYIGLYLDIYGLISFKLGITTDILISFWIRLAFIQGHSCMGNQKL